MANDRKSLEELYYAIQKASADDLAQTVEPGDAKSLMLARLKALNPILESEDVDFMERQPGAAKGAQALEDAQQLTPYGLAGRPDVGAAVLQFLPQAGAEVAKAVGGSAIFKGLRGLKKSPLPAQAAPLDPADRVAEAYKQVDVLTPDASAARLKVLDAIPGRAPRPPAFVPTPKPAANRASVEGAIRNAQSRDEMRELKKLLNNMSTGIKTAVDKVVPKAPPPRVQRSAPSPEEAKKFKDLVDAIPGYRK